MQKIKIIYTRLFHWEYWNSALLYLPVMPYLLYLFIKARAIFFFNAANPGIKNGGLIMESKWEIYKDAPENFFPKSLYVRGNEHFDQIALAARGSFTFPLIAKPDIGSKGRGVSIIKNERELHQYHNSCPVPYIIQEKIDHPMEAGIFYVRMPNERKGRITGIVEKIFVQVTGDAKSTIYELLQQNPRYLLQLSALKKIIEPQVLSYILPADKTRLLVDIGNHARGAYFVNVPHRINERLEQVIDEYCQQFPGFYFGRLDIRFAGWQALEQGKNFAVIELNGSGSEPTHIYDPANTLWYVWKEICRHWNWMYKVAKYNQQVNKHPYQSLKDGINLLLENKNYEKKLKDFLFSPGKDPAEIVVHENSQPFLSAPLMA
jgi:hypothetical protein